MFDYPAVIFASAFGPATVLLVGVLAAGRGQGGAPSVWVACFAAGALISAPASAWCNQSIAGLTGLPPEAVAAGVAPVVEEFFKGLVVASSFWWPHRDVRETLREWILRGCCVGLGFTAMENTQYLLLASLQGGMDGLWRGIFVRGFAWGTHHAVFAAMTAVAINSARLHRRDLPRAARWALGAVLLHVGWNTFVAAGLVEMICAAPEPGGACRWPPGVLELFVLTPVVSILALSPGLLSLRSVWNREGNGRPGR